MAKPRIFLSSTYYDLKNVRMDLEAFITGYGYEPVLFERGDIPWKSDKLETDCLKEILNCDVLINVIGGRFGALGADKCNSITQNELMTAINSEKSVYIFVEKSVQIEYEFWKKNRGLKGLKLHQADNPQIYEFLERLYSLPKQKSIQPFEHSQDIVSFLKLQWAGLFKTLLQEHASKKEEEHRAKNLKTEGKLALSGLKSLEMVQNAIAWRNWETLFNDAGSEIKLVFNYSERWLISQDKNIKKFLSKKGTSLKVILPNPEAADAVSCIATHKTHEPDTIKKLIAGTVAKLKNYGGSISVKMINKPMSYQLYIFDKTPVVLMYPLQDEKDANSFPLLEFGPDGEMPNYFNDEFDKMWESSLPIP